MIVTSRQSGVGSPVLADPAMLDRGSQDALVVAISQTSFPGARPASCGPQLSSQPTEQTQVGCVSRQGAEK